MSTLSSKFMCSCRPHLAPLVVAQEAHIPVHVLHVAVRAGQRLGAPRALLLCIHACSQQSITTPQQPVLEMLWLVQWLQRLPQQACGLADIATPTARLDMAMCMEHIGHFPTCSSETTHLCRTACTQRAYRQSRVLLRLLRRPPPAQPATARRSAVQGHAAARLESMVMWQILQ